MMALTPQTVGVGGAVVAAKPNLTKEDAKRFLKQVKREFADSVGKYATFRQLMIDFKDGRIDIDAMLLKANELLQGHNKLIIGFNVFLSEQDKVKVDEDDNLSPDEAPYYKDTTVNQTIRQIVKINLEDGNTDLCMLV